MKLVDADEIIRKLKTYAHHEPMFQKLSEYEFDLVALGISYGIKELNQATEINPDNRGQWIKEVENHVEYLTCPFCNKVHDTNKSNEFCEWCGAILGG